MLFGPDGLIKRYETPQDILLEFFHVRMQFYHKRRAFLIQVNITAAHMITVSCIPRHLSCMIKAQEPCLSCCCFTLSLTLALHCLQLMNVRKH
jgi:hypothetical protein